MENIPEKFERLENRVPATLKRVKSEIAEAEQKEATYQQRLSELKGFRWKAPLKATAYLAVNLLILAPWVVLSSAPLWLSLIIGCMLTYEGWWVYKSIEGKWGNSKALGFSESERKEKRKSMTTWEEFCYSTLALPQFLYVERLRLRMLLNESTSPSELKDDRLPTFRSLFHNIELWDRDITLINRLIAQAERQLIDLTEITPLVKKLRDDEQYLLHRISYAEYLLSEGQLGTSTTLVGSEDQLVDQIDNRLSEIAEHKEELRRLSGKLAARLEVVG